MPWPRSTEYLSVACRRYGQKHLQNAYRGKTQREHAEGEPIGKYNAGKHNGKALRERAMGVMAVNVTWQCRKRLFVS